MVLGDNSFFIKSVDSYFLKAKTMKSSESETQVFIDFIYIDNYYFIFTGGDQWVPFCYSNIDFDFQI